MFNLLALYRSRPAVVSWDICVRRRISECANPTCVRLTPFWNFSTKLRTTSPWSLRIRRQTPVSCDYKVNAAASDGSGLGGGGGEARGWEGLRADMHSIRMIYANYAHYSRRNLSSQSARINCRKLAIKFTVRGVWGEGRRRAKDIGLPRTRLAWPASPMLGIHGC